jgi:hypothetical protein
MAQTIVDFRVHGEAKANEIQEPLTHVGDIEHVVNSAAVPISIQLDRMFDSLPPDVDVAKVAFELILQLGAVSNRPEVTTLAGKVMSARRALEKIGYQF